MDKYEIMDKMVEQVSATQPLWGRWSIKEYLGSGAFSKVYRIEAELPDGTESSALKIEAVTAADVIVTSSKEKTEILERRNDEAVKQVSIMSRFKSCPYIVRYEEMAVQPFLLNGQLEGYCLLIRMELLDEVGDLMNSRKFDFKESNVLMLALNIGEGIRILHNGGVMHRDLKPQNLFVSDNGLYKVGDFNVSKKTDTAFSLAGAFPYMAPEVYRQKRSVNDSYTKQADIYSFGLCLYQMMNQGRLPLEEKYHDENLAFEHRMQKESFDVPREASGGFQYIIMKACAYNPSERYTTIHEMLTDLESLRAEIALPSRKNQGNQFKTVYASEEVGKQKESEKKNVQFPFLIVFLIVLVIAGGMILPKIITKDDAQTDSASLTTNSKQEVVTNGNTGFTVADSEVKPLYRWTFQDSLSEQSNLKTIVYGDTHIIDVQDLNGMNAAYFDGDGDYIECGTGINMTENFTFTTFLRCDDVDKEYTCFFAKYEINKAGAYAFSINKGHVNVWLTTESNAEYNSWFSSDSPDGYVELESATELINGQWYVLSIVKKGQSFSLYINGRLDAKKTVENTVTNEDVVTIGRQALVWEEGLEQLQYTGAIAEILIYDEALDSQQILEQSNEFIKLIGIPEVNAENSNSMLPYSDGDNTISSESEEKTQFNNDTVMGGQETDETIHKYEIYDVSMTWEAAKEYCESLGGHLVTISDQQEQATVISLLLGRENQNCYWIGLYKDGMDWKWLDDTPCSYYNWAANEPNNENAAESYVHLFGNTWTGGTGDKNVGEWNDTANDGAGYANRFYNLQNFGFICEWDN